VTGGSAGALAGAWPRPRLAPGTSPDPRASRHDGQAVRAEVPDRLSAFVDVVSPESGPVDGVLVPGKWEDGATRHHFLTGLFQGARLRTLPRTPRALSEFHASSKLLLLAHSEPALRRLGPVALLRAWSVRHGRDWVARQSLLEPYPAALRDGPDPTTAGAQGVASDGGAA
jgi:hypothetical protein